MAKAARTHAVRTSAARQGAGTAHSYWDASRLPLQVLSLVLPVCLAYEILLVVGLRSVDGATLTNRAHEGILRLFRVFGIEGAQVGLPSLSLPAVAVVLVLVLWQCLSRRPWRIAPLVTAGMVAESVLAALPLYVGGLVLSLALPALVASTGAVVGLGELVSPGGLDWAATWGLSLGAGLYEELIFRLALVSLLHAAFHDLVGVRDGWATWLAVVIAAVAFMLYHPIRDADGTVHVREAVFLLLAGLWFGALFVTRGFGIAVGSHAAYDVLALVAQGAAAAAAHR